MTICHKTIARQLVDLIDRFVKNDDPETEATQADATQAFVDLFSTNLESAAPRPIWQWRNFCKAILREMFPNDADFLKPDPLPPQAAPPELLVHKNETVIPFLIDEVMDYALFNTDELPFQEFASKILDEIFDDELVVSIRASQPMLGPLPFDWLKAIRNEP